MDYERLVNNKYEHKLKKSFVLKLNYYLFSELIYHGSFERIGVADFRSFNITKEIISSFKAASRINTDKADADWKLSVQEIDKWIELWDNDYKLLDNELYQNYRNHFKDNVFPFDKFLELYPKDKSKRKCHYCDITEEKIEILRHHKLINSKSPTRGYSLEIERFNSDYEYSTDNVVLACYWCNNAKTDEFTKEEFIEIVGPAFKQVWQNRIAKEKFGDRKDLL